MPEILAPPYSSDVTVILDFAPVVMMIAIYLTEHSASVSRLMLSKRACVADSITLYLKQQARPRRSF